MQRRSFLKAALPATAVALASTKVATTQSAQCTPNFPYDRRPRDHSSDQGVEKVKLAMLSTQRASWEQGVAAQALLEIGDYDNMLLLAKEAVLRQAEDGRLALVASDDNVADPASNGEAVLMAAKFTCDPAFSQAANRMLNYLLNDAPRTAKGAISHVKSGLQIWSDAIYMLPPFLAVAGQPAEAVKQVELYRDALWDDKAQLLSHIWDAGKDVWIDQTFWGCGQRMGRCRHSARHHALPPEITAARARLVSYAKAIIDGCLAHHREDGLFHNIWDDESSFVETNLAQMIAYSIYRGVQAGWLDKKYLASADHMRSAAERMVDRFGFVQGVCGSPNFDRPGTATEGQAFCLMMGGARRDWSEQTVNGRAVPVGQRKTR